MKEQLRKEIKLLWEDIQAQRRDGLGAGPAEERLGRLVMILRDLEAADASSRFTGSSTPMYRVGGPQ